MVESSTDLQQDSDATVPRWRAAGLRYFAYGRWLQQRFGQRIRRVSVDGAFTCPNVDGTVAGGGCIFCDNASFSPSRRLPRATVTEQINDGLQRIQRRYQCGGVLAYFQPGTNTYRPAPRLRALYEEALAHPNVVGLAVGTRADCAPDPVLELLEELARKTYVAVEFGMQTMHDRTLEWMNRGHKHQAFVDVIQRSRGRGFEVGAQVILGLPLESRQEMLETARELARLEIDSVKLHNLYVVRNTPLAEQYERGELELLDRDAYLDVAIRFLELLPPTTVIQRVSGDSPRQYFIAPTWCLDKQAVRGALEQEMRRRDTWQGKNFRVASR